jgi:hypothetical protein
MLDHAYFLSAENIIEADFTGLNGLNLAFLMMAHPRI